MALRKKNAYDKYREEMALRRAKMANLTVETARLKAQIRYESEIRQMKDILKSAGQEDLIARGGRLGPDGKRLREIWRSGELKHPEKYHGWPRIQEKWIAMAEQEAHHIEWERNAGKRAAAQIVLNDEIVRVLTDTMGELQELNHIPMNRVRSTMRTGRPRKRM